MTGLARPNAGRVWVDSNDYRRVRSSTLPAATLAMLIFAVNRPVDRAEANRVNTG